MEAAKNFCFRSVLCVALLAVFAAPTKACMCRYIPPKDMYCKSNYAALVQIVKKSYDASNRWIFYGVEIKEAYKMTPEIRYRLEHEGLKAVIRGSCSLDMEVGQLYAIAAEQLELRACNTLANEFSTMSTEEVLGLRGEYAKSCNGHQ